MRRPHKMAPHSIIRKVLTITLSLLGIAFILWLNSWFTAYVDLSKFNEKLSAGLLFLVGFKRQLVWTITAFTLAHSVTLACSALDLITLRSLPVEADRKSTRLNSSH